MDVYQHSDSESGASQFIRECHSLVRDLYRPDVRLYFSDFLITYAVMVLGFWGVLLYAQVISVSTLSTLYVIVGSWMFLNQFRTITAHRYSGDGTNQGMLEQLLDSNTFDRGWLPELWAPVGLRYHALHHLLPALPYHQMGKAHQRLLVGLPSDSPYHQTRQGSLFLAVLDSFHFGRRINFSNKT